MFPMAKRLVMMGTPRRFYVDFTGGNDSNNGRSPGAAWKTVAAVNAYTQFRSGDQILFKRGETWVLTAALTVPLSGLKFGAYGSGAKPILDGQDIVSCVIATNKSNLRFENIECTQGLDSGLQFNTCSNVTVIDCDCHECGNDNLVFITGCSNCQVIRGSFYNGYQRVPTTIVSGIEIADDCTDILIDGVTCYGQLTTSGMGVTIHSHAGTGMPNRITVQNSIFRNNAGHGLQVMKQDDADDTGDGITIANCLFYSNALDGIRIYKTGAGTHYPNGVIVRDNYSYLNTQYAYFFSGDNLIIRNNRFAGRGFLTACVNLSFYNNSMWFNTGGGLYPIFINNVRTDTIRIKNNIHHMVLAGGMAIGVENTVTSANIDINYNLYYLQGEAATATRWHWKGTSYSYANWLTNSGQDVNSPAADQDPLMVDPANGDYTLQVGSPAIDAGVDVGLAYLGLAPDCGYAEKA